MSDHLNDHTDSVDNTTVDDSPLAADEVCDITTSDGANECTKRQDRDNEGGVRGRDGVGAGALDILNEDCVSEHTIDITGVVTEEDTTEGGKGADHVGLEGDGSFNAVDIGGGLENDGPSRGVAGCLGVALYSLVVCHIGVMIWGIWMTTDRVMGQSKEWQGLGKMQEGMALFMLFTGNQR